MFRKILQNRVVIIIVLAVATVGLAFFLTNIRIDGSITKVLPENDPVFEYNKKIEQQFGSTEEIIFLISSEGSVFDKDILPAIEKLMNSMGTIEGVKRDEAASITVLAENLPSVSSIEIGDGMTDSDAVKIRDAVNGNPLLRGKMVSEDEKSTLVSFPVSIDISYNDESLTALVSEVNERVEAFREENPELTVELSGHPVIQSAIMQYMSNDLLKLFPLALVVVMVLLLIFLRSFKAMLIPIMVTLISILWTFGLKGILNSPITLTETVIPVILISLGCADGIHILSEFQHYYNRNMPPVLAVKKGMENLSTPIILTSVTTALGFSSLALANGASLRNMGIFLAFGVIVAMGFSLLYIPIILSSFTLKKQDNPELGKKHFNRMRFLQHSALGILRFWPIPIALVLAMLAASVFGLIRTEPDTDEVRYFKASTPVRQITERIEENFGGIGTLYIVFESDTGDRFREADAIRMLSNVQESLASNSNVGYSMSVADYVKLLFYSLRGNNPDFYTIPDSDPLIRRMAGMLTSTAPVDPEMLYDYVSEDFSTACLQVRLKDSNTSKMKSLLAEIEPVLQEQVPEDISVNFAGDYIRLKNGENIVRSQIISLLTTIATILVILSIFFQSPIIGMLITFPVSIAILFNFAVMWIFDVSLNPATAIIAAVGLGVGVDYGIHFFSRFRLLYKKSGKYIHSIVDAIVETAKGIFSNAFAVGIGFLVLLFSSYSIINDIGWIVAVSMITTALLTITIIPILLVLFKPKIPDTILFIRKSKLEG